MNVRTRRAGTRLGRLQSRLGSGERAGARESIYESGNQESRKTEVAASIHFASPIGLHLINRVQMKFFLIDVFIAMASVLVLVQPLPAQESQPEKPKQFIYVLRLVPRLHADANWTEEDKKALQRHFV